MAPPEAAWDGRNQDLARPRELGWIDVTAGQIAEGSSRRILTMSTLQAEDRAGLSFKPAAWLRQLRRNLQAQYSFGIRGTNVVHGGSHDYKEIGYSLKALALQGQGTVWKQFATDNTEYVPL